MKALVVQNVDIEGPGLLQPEMEKAGWRLDIRIMDQPGATLPADLNGYKALIVLGGPMNVYEEELYPYLRQVDYLIKDAVQKDLPLMGICLGGQLISKALGAAVTRNPVEEIGWYELHLTDEGKKSPLFEGLPEVIPVFQWHGDTFALPDGASHLAMTTDCAHQAFSVGRHVFALQFHLEITPEIVDTWVSAYADELDEFGGPGAAMRIAVETRTTWGKYERTAAQFLNNWVRILASAI
ncbi:MAG: type 1 glutamine amidotransferase [Firmicutes bacterium]|nr:type 1 glutamine amidotransferase [Bacillota bacterium]